MSDASRIADQDYRAETARRLLNDEPLLAEALTSIRMDALLDLAEADPDDKTSILRHQATVYVTGEIKSRLEAEILRSGTSDGGVSAS